MPWVDTFYAASSGWAGNVGFYITAWAGEDFFYVPESTHWAEDDYFYIPDDIIWGAADPFYLPRSSEELWLLPLDRNFEHVKATANFEELAVMPEDLTIVPELVQFRRAEWERDESEDIDDAGSWSIRTT